MSEQRATLVMEVVKEEQDRYKWELRQEMADMKKLRDAAKSNAAMFFKLANNALRELTGEDDNLRACSKADKHSINKHSDSAIKSAQAVASLNDRIYQVDILLERLERE